MTTNAKQPFSLAGKVAWITGSSTGLGKVMAMQMGAAGAKVTLNYANNQARAEQTFKEFQDAGHEGILLRGNVIEEAEVNRMAREIADSLGPVDILVVNATPDQPQMPIEEYTWEFYQSMLDFFIKSPYLLTRAVLPHMKAQRWGRIINIGSEVFTRGVPNFTAYCAAKGGQNGFNRSLASELAPFGITVNMISPGWIPVERHEKDPQEMKDEYLAGLPSKRWGVPKEVADTAVFLASDEASYVSGQNIAVNGAHTLA
ncbi:MAG: 3-oxoacyl-ACP reductase FabG [Candidatus Hydrogenedentes bacterium]|nr:3-oxoacyl-ACP reductase FabG [Candidatus Hydrogenedentota bacterium]